MRRVVLFRKKAEVNDADFHAALAVLQSLDRRMSEMTSWWVEGNSGVEGMWDAALVADFPDVAACKAYEVHPEHVAAAGGMGGVCSEFAVFDTP